MNWKNVFKFLSGFFAATSITNFYLYTQNFSTTFLGFNITPNIILIRAIIHSVLFLIFFYLGFVKKN